MHQIVSMFNLIGNKCINTSFLQVICSNLIKYYDNLDKKMEREIFSELFECNDLNDSYSYYNDSYIPVGYQYIKR